jgi:hypothetical protein
MWIMLSTGSCWIIRDQPGQLGESGEYWMGRVRVMDHKFRAPMVVAPACVD